MAQAWLCFALALGATAPVARASRPLLLDVVTTWNAATPELSFEVVDFVDRSVADKLESGLAQTLVTRVLAYTPGAKRPVSVGLASCRIVYDLWQEQYRVEQQRGTQHARTWSQRSAGKVIERCLRFHKLRIGRPGDFARVRGQRVFFEIVVELNPLSPATLQRIRRWLARPGAGGQLERSAFFGSFVSMFVNRRIGSAQRTRRYRSAVVSVP
ncbi:MAG: hypothetical protein MJD61_17220 [Proteobacteria bacterium]|nr:hypothetical protein [Pseudomonadota bacterium]